VGEKTSGIVAAIARSVGEEKEFERFWMIVEALQRLFEKDPDADAVRRRLAAIFSLRITPEGLLTRRELIALWEGFEAGDPAV
jgi:hypothetical protein